MFFSLEDKKKKNIKKLSRKEFSQLDIKETEDIENWAIKNPELLGEELLIIASQYGEFEELNKRLDLLALDKDGKLVAVELKRDKADKTADLQVIKYASYVANLASKDLQEIYKKFWKKRGEKFTIEEVGEIFSSFLTESDKEIETKEEGWIKFELDNKPRIILAAGDFGKEITAPVIWLIDEYGMDMTCIELNAYKHQGEIVINSRIVLPVPETEDYMAKRRQKKEKQGGGIRRRAAVEVLLDKGVISEDHMVVFKKSKIPDGSEVEWDPSGDFWRAKVTGKRGRSKNIKWLENNQEYSFSGLAQIILNECEGKDRDATRHVNGYKFWCLAENNETSLSEIRSKLESY